MITQAISVRVGTPFGWRGGALIGELHVQPVPDLHPVWNTITGFVCARRAPTPGLLKGVENAVLVEVVGEVERGLAVQYPGLGRVAARVERIEAKLKFGGVLHAIIVGVKGEGTGPRVAAGRWRKRWKYWEVLV